MSELRIIAVLLKVAAGAAIAYYAGFHGAPIILSLLLVADLLYIADNSRDGHVFGHTRKRYGV